MTALLSPSQSRQADSQFDLVRSSGPHKATNAKKLYVYASYARKLNCGVWSAATKPATMINRRRYYGDQRQTVRDPGSLTTPLRLPYHGYL